MQTELNRKKRILMNFAYAALVFAIYYVVFRYLFYVAWPFVAALLFCLCTRKPIKFLSRKTHIPEKGAAAIVVTVFYLIIAGILILVVLKAFWAIVDWSGNLPQIYQESIKPVIEKVFEWIRDHASVRGDNDDYLVQLGATILGKLDSVVSWFSGKAVTVAKNVAVGVPKTMLSILFMVISTYFMAIDYKRIASFFMAQFTPNQQQIIVSSKEFLGNSISKILVSYAMIMCITFVELNIALRILHIANPTTIALIIAIFDILPALGCGGVLIPWAIIAIIGGNYKLALGLIISYVIMAIIRNIIEPKIVGEKVGVHPVLMLLSIYLGVWLLGPFGIIIVPFTIIVVKKLNDAGLVHVFNSEYDLNGNL